LISRDGTFLHGNSSVTFLHEGLKSASNHAETLAVLRKLTAQQDNFRENKLSYDCKLLNYLIALDGHLDGRSYRDIAEVIYGKDRVGASWTADTQWMKSKVRRAVERGIALMNGGYRDHL
jgi:hypothetical protein